MGGLVTSVKSASQCFALFYDPGTLESRLERYVAAAFFGLRHTARSSCAVTSYDSGPFPEESERYALEMNCLIVKASFPPLRPLLIDGLTSQSAPPSDRVQNTGQEAFSPTPQNTYENIAGCVNHSLYEDLQKRHVKLVELLHEIRKTPDLAISSLPVFTFVHLVSASPNKQAAKMPSGEQWKRRKIVVMREWISKAGAQAKMLSAFGLLIGKAGRDVARIRKSSNSPYDTGRGRRMILPEVTGRVALDV